MENLGESSRRLLYLLLGVASVFVIIWGIRSSAVIINPILLALVITITVLPLPGKLKQRGMPGWLALAITMGLVIGGLAVILAVAAYSVGRLAAAIPTYVNEASVQQAQLAAGQLQHRMAWLADALAAVLKPEQVAVVAAQTVQIIGNSVVLIFMVLLIFIFMLSGAIALPRGGRAGLDVGHPMVERFARFTVDVRRYVVIMTGINFLVGVGNTILLLALGVDFAVLWGVLSWVLGYIPTIGFWLALIPPVILAYAEFGFGTALVVFVAYVLINGGVQNLLQPRLMGQGLRISPLVVFVSVFVWGWLLGGIGAILSVPLTLIILDILEGFPSTQWMVALARYMPGADPAEQRSIQEQIKQGWSRIKATWSG